MTAARVVPMAVCAVLSVAGCSAEKHHPGFSDAGRFTETPDSCALMPPSLVKRLIGAAVAGERVDDKAVTEEQECSWMKVADADHPDAQFGQVTVFVQRGTENSVDNAVQAIIKGHDKELTQTGCTPARGITVDQSCVFPDTGIPLVAFRTSNLFVRVTCSVRNPNMCSGGQRQATAELLAKTVLQKL
ncbi:hypothetical protein [Actinoallomurus sp. CA-142502]|uniref:hypothetical protein n=1 Tax=Actinoallomurus sp. CA-142502 TaxID=3239885 RepID=UPI003D91E0E1